jgi:hypothetical protein
MENDRVYLDFRAAPPFAAHPGGSGRRSSNTSRHAIFSRPIRASSLEAQKIL